MKVNCHVWNTNIFFWSVEYDKRLDHVINTKREQTDCIRLQVLMAVPIRHGRTDSHTVTIIPLHRIYGSCFETFCLWFFLFEGGCLFGTDFSVDLFFYLFFFKFGKERYFCIKQCLAYSPLLHILLALVSTLNLLIFKSTI